MYPLHFATLRDLVWVTPCPGGGSTLGPPFRSLLCSGVRRPRLPNVADPRICQHLPPASLSQPLQEDAELQQEWDRETSLALLCGVCSAAAGRGERDNTGFELENTLLNSKTLLVECNDWIERFLQIVRLAYNVLSWMKIFTKVRFLVDRFLVQVLSCNSFAKN